MANAEEVLLIPKNLDEAKELVNKLSIEDLRFCFTFGLTQDGTKASLKERLFEYYKGKFTLETELLCQRHGKDPQSRSRIRMRKKRLFQK